MSKTPTTNYGWQKPDYNTEDDTWGVDLNTIFDSIDALIKSKTDTLALSAPTGAVQDFLMTSAPTGWLVLDGSTIGDASSGAGRANADTVALFTVLWNNFNNTVLPILDSTGSASTRGASAAADYAAHKRMPLVDQRDRFRRSYKSGGSSAAIGVQQAGAYPAHTHTFHVDQGGTFAGSGNVSYMQGTTNSASGAYNGTTDSTGSGSDNRPINISYLTCIKL